MSINFGTEKEFLDGTITGTSVARLDSTHFVVAYIDGSDLNHGTAKIGTVSGQSVTFGAESEFLSANGATFVGVARLDATHFVVTYRDTSDANHGTAKIGTVSGTSITFGAETEFLGANAEPYVVALSATKFVVVYSASGGGEAKVGVVSGTDITFGPAYVFYAGATGWLGAAALSSTLFAVVYRKASPFNGAAKVGSVAGQVVTYGAEVVFGTGTTTHISATALDFTRFVVAYRDGADANHGTCKVGAVSGITISFGAETEFLVTAASYNSVVMLNSTNFAVVYSKDADSNHGESRLGTVSGTSITFGTAVKFLAATAAVNNFAARLDAGVFIVAYQDGSDSNHGTVKIGVESTLANFFGLEAEFLSAGSASPISAVELSVSQFVVAYGDNADSGNGTAKVCTVSGTIITFGAEAEFFTGDSTYISVIALSAGKFVVAYRNGFGNGTVKVGTVTGTSITFSAEYEFESTGASSISAAALSSTVFVVAYEDVFGHGQARVGTVSGTNVTWGTEGEFQPSSGGVPYNSVAPLAADKFIVAYGDGNDFFHGTAKVGTVTGTSITFGAETEFLSAGAATYVIATALSASKFVVGYSDGADSDHGTAKVGTVSGTNITFGAEAEFLSAGAVIHIFVKAQSDSQFVIAYWDNAGFSHGAAKIGTVSGTGIVFGTEMEFLLDGGAYYNSVSALSADRFAVAYWDDADSGHGTVRVSGGGGISSSLLSYERMTKGVGRGFWRGAQ